MIHSFVQEGMNTLLITDITSGSNIVHRGLSVPLTRCGAGFLRR